jgi:hypothetical protein
LRYNGLTKTKKEAAMTDFTIAEDFPKSEIEFDARFSNPDACYQYLFRLKWPDGFVCIKCGHKRGRGAEGKTIVSIAVEHG